MNSDVDEAITYNGIAEVSEVLAHNHFILLTKSNNVFSSKQTIRFAFCLLSWRMECYTF